MDLKKMYRVSLDNAFDLAKVAKSKDDVALVKASIYAQIATAIATGVMDLDLDENEPVVQENEKQEEAAAIPEVKEETEPAPEEKPVDPKVIALVQEEPLAEPPDRYEDEAKDDRKKRYDYLLARYKDTLIKDLPKDLYPYLMPESNVNAMYEWLWDEALHDNSADRKKTIVEDLTGKKASSVGDVTLEMYLTKVIPCELDWIYFMMFEDSSQINDVLAKITSNRYKDFRDLSTFSVGVWRTAAEKYMEQNFDAIEKVS